MRRVYIVRWHREEGEMHAMRIYDIRRYAAAGRNACLCNGSHAFIQTGCRGTLLTSVAFNFLRSFDCNNL